ncbi:hypothetical protein BKA62DRAFT_673611 [Auriculariales sp. MPI-PUGE-AT-0066]|nr:hypothetical protein BKA62DRAFT_673611 [Auriculariales sp. MPI-PUGE-AT-0066]
MDESSDEAWRKTGAALHDWSTICRKGERQEMLVRRSKLKTVTPSQTHADALFTHAELTSSPFWSFPSPAKKRAAARDPCRRRSCCGRLAPSTSQPPLSTPPLELLRGGNLDGSFYWPLLVRVGPGKALEWRLTHAPHAVPEALASRSVAATSSQTSRGHLNPEQNFFSGVLNLDSFYLAGHPLITRLMVDAGSAYIRNDRNWFFRSLWAAETGRQSPATCLTAYAHHHSELFDSGASLHVLATLLLNEQAVPG